MYNPNQSASSRRAGEELLRRMNQSESIVGACGMPRPRQEMPPMPSGCVCDHNDHAHGYGCAQSGNPYMPALAMVYSPEQEWTCLMDTPEMALAHGTLFHELFKPFEGGVVRRSQKC